MKTTKRILAIVLAALMLAAMIPFAVSAAGDTYTLNVKSSKEGFNFEVIKVADINTETGAYTSEYAGVVDALNKGGITGAKAVLAICDNIKWNELDYVPAGKWTDGTDTGVKPITGLAAGVYYIKSEATDKAPAGSKVQNRIIPIPYYENNAWVPAVENGVGVYPETIDLASKAEIVPKVSKKILDGDDTVNGLYDVTAIGQDVTFELTADVTGSVEASEDNILTGKLSRYAITDTYEKGLTFKPGTVEVKFVNDTTTTSTTDFTVEEGTGSFKVALGDDTLKGNDFYSYKKVVVTYKATLNKDAKIGKEGNENADGLEYKHNAEPETAPVHEVPGNTVYVFTLKIDVTKVDAATKEAIKVAGVKFALFGEDKETKIGEEKETDAEGKLSFVGLDKGTYYVQETKAPEGYNLNTSKHEVKLVPVITADATGKYTMELDLTAGNSGNVTVEDTKSEVPTTGGVGTMMFTVVGGALIIAAGVLLVIVLKKRAK
ncbi:MAG: SpaH/EbpB family LPXTG-anchored major pilin [Ruminococcus sp.]|nr:SpaH/EbpB family LPXTG-anchored major pilin [Ruminococcus sp.]